MLMWSFVELQLEIASDLHSNPSSIVAQVVSLKLLLSPLKTVFETF
jgi:hypothetical protein